MFGLQISGGLGRTSKIIEIKISSLQVFSYQQLLQAKARFFSNVSMWVYYIQLCMPKPEKPQLFAQNQALGGSLFSFWVSLLFMFYPGFHSSPGNLVNTQTTFRSNQRGVFSPGPSSTIFYGWLNRWHMWPLYDRDMAGTCIYAWMLTTNEKTKVWTQWRLQLHFKFQINIHYVHIYMYLIM